MLHVLMFLTTLSLLIGLWQGGKTLGDYFELYHSKEVLVETIKNLEKDIKTTQTEILRIHKSDSYALKVLRDKYHVLEKNEEIIFFAD